MRGRLGRRHAVLLFALLVLLYMFMPIFVVSLMSFNDPVGRLGYDFDGFTLRQLDDDLRALPALRVGAARASRSGCSPPGSPRCSARLMAFAMVRHHFRGRAAPTC